MTHLCGARQSQQEDDSTDGEDDEMTFGFSHFGEGITNAGEDHFYRAEEEE